MKEADKKKIQQLLRDIRGIAASLPAGKSRQVANKCGKILVIINKQNNGLKEYKRQFVADGEDTPSLFS